MSERDSDKNYFYLLDENFDSKIDSCPVRLARPRPIELSIKKISLRFVKLTPTQNKQRAHTQQYFRKCIITTNHKTTLINSKSKSHNSLLVGFSDYLTFIVCCVRLLKSHLWRPQSRYRNSVIASPPTRQEAKFLVWRLVALFIYTEQHPHFILFNWSERDDDRHYRQVVNIY